MSTTLSPNKVLEQTNHVIPEGEGPIQESVARTKAEPSLKRAREEEELVEETPNVSHTGIIPLIMQKRQTRERRASRFSSDYIM
jgi:hypothetical protein